MSEHSDKPQTPCSCPETTGGPHGSPGPMCINPNAPGCRKRAQREMLMRQSIPSAGVESEGQIVEALRPVVHDIFARLLSPGCISRGQALQLLVDAVRGMRSATPRREGGRKLVYNKATRKIEVVTKDGAVTDSFDPPQECP